MKISYTQTCSRPLRKLQGIIYPQYETIRRGVYIFSSSPTSCISTSASYIVESMWYLHISFEPNVPCISSSSPYACPLILYIPLVYNFHLPYLGYIKHVVCTKVYIFILERIKDDRAWKRSYGCIYCFETNACALVSHMENIACKI